MAQKTTTDIVISIYPKHVKDIIARVKDHEFRKYLIPAQRIWIYETAPISAIRYYAVIEKGKEPGQLAEGDLVVVKNKNFNDGSTLKAGGSGSKYAHKITELYRLERGWPLKDLKEKGWLKAAPQKYNFALEDMVIALKPSATRQF